LKASTNGGSETMPARSGRDNAFPGDDLRGRSLTAREHQVLCLLARGMANRHIARSLGITESTVKNHLRSVFAKLDVVDRTQAALIAVRTGLSE
jgi:DNA-binding NarL/FixJ family response regulator